MIVRRFVELVYNGETLLETLKQRSRELRSSIEEFITGLPR